MDRSATKREGACQQCLDSRERSSPSSQEETSGIGLATAKRFVKEGAYVFITEKRRKAELDKAEAEIGSNVTAVKRGTLRTQMTLTGSIKRSRPRRASWIYCLRMPELLTR